MIKKIILKRLLRKSRSIKLRVEFLTLKFINEIVNEISTNKFKSIDRKLFEFLDDVNNVYKEELTK